MYQHTYHDGNCVRTFTSNTPPKPRPFLKPFYSKYYELEGREDFYYIVAVNNFADVMEKAGIRTRGPLRYAQYGSDPYFTRHDIDKFPKYMRRGGIYGHDTIRAKKGTLNSYVKNLCRTYKIEIIYL